MTRHRLLLTAVLIAAAVCMADARSLVTHLDLSPHGLVEDVRPPSNALRVCADPNNMPFSDRDQRGFENRIAARMAAALGRPLEYYWKPTRRGFIRTTLRAGECDIVMGVPSAFELARTTRPYYRASYVFVEPAARPEISSLDDPRLRHLRIGIEITGEDYDNPPPAQALASRGLVANVRGFTVYGDYSQPTPPKAVIDAVADGRVDVAVAWGPRAAYFAERSATPLRVLPVSPQMDLPFLPFVFDISMGVRRDDPALFDAADHFIETHQTDIDAVLREYRVPVADGGGA